MLFEVKNVDITVNGYLFKSVGHTVLFKGYSAAYEEGTDEKDEEMNNRVPELKDGETLDLKETLPEQKFTLPPSHLYRGDADPRP